MMHELERKVRDFSETYGLFAEEDKILIGISGGADSVCLFCVLLSLRAELGLTLRCVHVHHGIRGAAADADAAFSRRLSERYGVPIDIVRVNVPEMAKREKMSEEEAGRLARRRIFKEQMATYGLNKVALAHHMDDQAETVIMHLCRGTTLKGLSGIAPRNGSYIRPLLNVRRRDIEAYLKDRGEAFVTDETNFSDDYTRNAVRHRVIPVLTECVNAKTVEHMGELALYMGRVKAYFLEEAHALEKAACEERADTCVLHLDSVRNQPGILKGEILYTFLSRMVPVQSIEAVHIDALRDLMAGDCGRRYFFPMDVRCEKAENRLLLYKAGKSAVAYADVPLKAGEWVTWGEYEIKLERGERYSVKIPKEQEITYTKCFDCDIIEGDLVVRSRLPGDYMVIDQEGKRQKIKKTFINEKVPQSHRNSVPLVAAGSRVFWAIGVKCGVETKREGEPFIRVSVRKETKRWKTSKY